MTDHQIEHEIQAKGKTAPRITPADIEANIVGEYFFTADEGVYGNARNPMEPGSLPDNFRLGDHPLSLLTFCILVLRNGFTVTGESACASPENFDAVLGKKIARQKAVEKIWPLMGYELKTWLSNGGL